MIATQLEIESMNDTNKYEYVRDLRAAGVQMVLLAMEDYFYEGDVRKSFFAKLKDFISFFKAEGFFVAVWTTSLGYGGERNEMFHKRFGNSIKLRCPAGIETTAVCTTDEEFLAEIKQKTRDIISAGADYLLWDDELVQSVRPGLGCTCKNHLKMVSDKVGRQVGESEVLYSFAGRANDVRTAFIDSMGETLMHFCKELRKAADEINPDAGMGICASYTHYDIEGVNIDELLAVLAGRRKPFFRISGAPYWPVIAPRYVGQDISGVLEFARMQLSWFKERDMILLDENDPFPRDHKIVSEKLQELYDDVMIAEGGAIRHKYFLCMDYDHNDRAYIEAHIKRIKEHEKEIEIFKNTICEGFKVCHPERFIKEANLPEEFIGEHETMGLFSHPMGGTFLALRGVPTTYSKTNEAGIPSIAIGEEAVGLTEKDLLAGVLIDIPAANLLRERGVMIPDAISLTDNIDYAENTLGQKFAIMKCDALKLDMSRLGTHPITSYELAVAYKKLSGNNLPAYVLNSPDIYIISTKKCDNGAKALLISNTNPSGAATANIVISGENKLTQVEVGALETCVVELGVAKNADMG